MKNEAEFCTIVKNSLVTGFKIPDPGYGNFTNTSKRCFDGIGMLESENGYHFVCWEAKYMKKLQSFSMTRLEPHQAYYLTEYSKAYSVDTYIILGIDLGRNDKRAYVFKWMDIEDLYKSDFSIYKQFLERLPYNEVSKGKFFFDNIIDRDELIKVYGNLELAKQQQILKREQRKEVDNVQSNL